MAATIVTVEFGTIFIAIFITDKRNRFPVETSVSSEGKLNQVKL